MAADAAEGVGGIVKVYSIRDWNDNFEVAQSRKLTSALPWVAIPTKHDGKSYRRVMRSSNGPALYAAWILIVQVAAKCPRRGVLADADGPLDADDLETKTDCPAALFEQAIKTLSSPKIGWLMVDEWEDGGRPLPAQTGQTEQDRQNEQDTVTRSDKSTPRAKPTELQQPDEKSASDQKQSDLKEIKPTDEEIGERSHYAAQLFKLSDYRGNDGLIFWQAAMLIGRGIAEQWAVSAANGAGLNAKENRPGFFRCTLAETCEANGVDLKRQLARVKLPKGKYTSAPPRPERSGADLARAP